MTMLEVLKIVITGEVGEHGCWSTTGFSPRTRKLSLSLILLSDASLCFRQLYSSNS